MANTVYPPTTTGNQINISWIKLTTLSSEVIMQIAEVVRENFRHKTHLQCAIFM